MQAGQTWLLRRAQCALSNRVPRRQDLELWRARRFGMLLSAKADRTGGFFWHMRALVARRSLWVPFREEVESWLAGWTPPHRKLLLVGPSAGWCLPDSFLTRFEEITAVDIDPFAKPLFSLLHGRALRRAGVRLSWSQTDFFADPAHVLHAHPDATVLFCNVAGQRCVQTRDSAAVEQEMLRLRALLQGRSWASFHDLLSAETHETRQARHLAQQMSAYDLLSSYGLGGEWFDHLTGQLLPPNSPRRIMPWRINRGRLHLIEAGWVEG